MSCEKGGKVLVDLVDAAIRIPILIVRLRFGYPATSQVRCDGIDRCINPWDGHVRSSPIVTAPALFRLASTPWPNARATSLSIMLRRSRVAEACREAATRFWSQSAAA